MIWLYVAFILFVLVMLAVDLLVVNRDPHVIRAREALGFTAFNVALALIFGVGVYFMYQHDWPHGVAHHLIEQAKVRAPEAAAVPTERGWEATILYLTAWVTEYALSIDNIFVIAVIFKYFSVPQKYQRRVLFWGIIGALVLRGIMIWGGIALIDRFQWMLYVFGAILIVTAIKMLRAGDEEPDPSKNIAIRAARKIFRFTPDFEGQKFFTRVHRDRPSSPHSGAEASSVTGSPSNFDAAPLPAPLGRGILHATPMFMVLIVVETTDVVFAVDSIPAVIGITTDPFLVFTSNVFAILGLRSLYFALASVMGSFRYLKVSLVFVLAFVGLKMLVHHWWEPPIVLSLGVIVGLILVGVLASALATAKERRRKRTPMEDLSGAVEVTRRNLKRVLILIAGSVVILGGLAISWLPGPGGIPLVIAGLMILATEFVWAQRLIVRLKRQANAMASSTDELASKSSPWLIPPVLMVWAAVLLTFLEYTPIPDMVVFCIFGGMLLPIGFWGWRTLRVHRSGPSEVPRTTPAESTSEQSGAASPTPDVPPSPRPVPTPTRSSPAA